MIKFEKWHGNGNDFVIINSIEQKIKLKEEFHQKILPTEIKVWGLIN
jgi:diaminopimelate epimerase